MPIPSNLDARIRFDESNIPSICGNGHGFSFVSNERLVVDLTIEKLQQTVPPSYAPVSIVGWTGRWIAKLDVDDPDLSKKFDVSGVITDGPNGKIRFEVPKATVNFIGNHIYSEFVFIPTGTEVVYRILFVFNLTKPGLTI